MQTKRTGKGVRVRPSARRIVRTKPMGRNRSKKEILNRRAALRTQGGALKRAAYLAGVRAAHDIKESDSGLNGSLDHSYRQWFVHKVINKRGRPSFKNAMRTSIAFCDGYKAGGGSVGTQLLLPIERSAAAVISVNNEERNLSKVLRELSKLPLEEIIVVLNGCTDGSFVTSKQYSKVTVLHFPERLGHDVGRALGAMLASADIVLFTDGDIPISARFLAPFLYAVDGGIDIALNNISPYYPEFVSQDDTTICKYFLNNTLGRADLQGNSLTAIPHAMSRNAVHTLGISSLMVPPKAQALAILQGLKVSAPCSVNVINRNRIRQDNYGHGNKVSQLIVGDHLEALDEALKWGGSTLNYPDMPRAKLAKARNG